MADDGSSGECGRERLEIAHAQRIDDRDLIARDELNGHQARGVGLFVMELRIESDALDAFEPRA